MTKSTRRSPPRPPLAARSVGRGKADDKAEAAKRCATWAAVRLDDCRVGNSWGGGEGLSLKRALGRLDRVLVLVPTPIDPCRKDARVLPPPRLHPYRTYIHVCLHYIGIVSAVVILRLLLTGVRNLIDRGPDSQQRLHAEVVTSGWS